MSDREKISISSSDMPRRTRLKPPGLRTKQLIVRVFPVANNREKNFGTPGRIQGL